MKPFNKLTLADLRSHPVWRYSTIGDDSVAWVEVDERQQLSERDSGTFIALTTFRLADGSELAGLCSPSDPSGLDYLQPVILTPAGHLSLWIETVPGRRVVASACKHLARRSDSIFPLTFECSVPVDGVRVAGAIDVNDAASADQSLSLSIRLTPSE